MVIMRNSTYTELDRRGILFNLLFYLFRLLFDESSMLTLLSDSQIALAKCSWCILHEELEVAFSIEPQKEHRQHHNTEECSAYRLHIQCYEVFTSITGVVAVIEYKFDVDDVGAWLCAFFSLSAPENPSVECYCALRIWLKCSPSSILHSLICYRMTYINRAFYLTWQLRVG